MCFWCHSKIDYGKIMQLLGITLYVVYYRIFQAYLIAITEKNLVLAEGNGSME